MASKSLTVSEYSDVVVRKYLQGAFSDDPRANVTAAAEEVYVLLRKLMDATGGNQKSDDSKAPLKAIRNVIDIVISSNGPSAPEVDALFSLYARLEELCEERIAQNTDPHGGQMVQDVLRYRLSRLVTTDTWDAQPELKLRVLKLMFNFMVRENERLMEEGRDVPSLKLGRGLSLGRSRSRDLGPKRHSKWTDAVTEVGRLPGTKLLPMMKLLLLENMQLMVSQPQGTGSPATPTLGAGTLASQSPLAAPGGLLDELMGLNLGPAGGGDSEALSRRSSSPTPSSSMGGGGGEDPFAGMAESRRKSSGQGYPPRAGSPTPSNSSSVYTGSAAAPGVNTPPVYSYAPSQQSSGMHPASAINIGTTGHFGGGPGSYSNSSNLPPLSPSPGSAHRYNSGNLQFSGSAPTGAPAELQRQISGNEVLAQTSAFNTNFDASSPYLVSSAPVGNPHPFDVQFFNDVSPVPPQPRPVSDNRSPPMRGSDGFSP